MTETEIKLRFSDPAEMVARLGRLGWKAQTERQLEINRVYDREGQPLAEARCLLRVREEAGHCRLTFKRPKGREGPHKVREEHETEVGDAEAIGEILAGLGYRVVWRYEKFRTRFEQAGQAGKILVDETPIGNFLELEGNADWIDRTAKELGYAPSDYVTATYLALFASHQERSDSPRRDMVF